MTQTSPRVASIHSLLAAVSMLGLLAGSVAAQSPRQATDEPSRPQVMILGTFHFEGSAADAISVTMGDMLSQRRQAEIEEVIDRLARFRPTQIMIEATSDREARINEIYRAYLAGSHDLSANESQQIGMRLARKLGLQMIHAVDHQQPMDFERMMRAGAEAGQQELLGWFQARIADVQQTLAAAQSSDKTLLDALRFHNGPWAMSSNSLYLQLAVLGTPDNPAGAEVIGSWYERNLKIYANIARAIRSPNERVLVIYGSGHLPHLARFFEENPRYQLVSALDVLGEPSGEHTHP
jgi:hypothetical protein